MGITVVHHGIGQADIPLAIFLKGRLKPGDSCGAKKIIHARDPENG